MLREAGVACTQVSEMLSKNEAKIDLNRQKEVMKIQKKLRTEKRENPNCNIEELNKESQLEKILFKIYLRVEYKGFIINTPHGH